MKRKFSFKAFILTFVVLVLAFGGFVSSKVSDVDPSEAKLHSVLVSLDFEDEYDSLESTNDIHLVPDVGSGEDVTEIEVVNDKIEAIIEDEEASVSISKSDVRAVISLVVYDFGLSKQASERVFDIDVPNLTLAVSPYSDRPSYWADSAHRFQAEPWGSLYVYQASSSEDKDYGPLSIIEGLSKEMNDKRLSLSLKRFSNVEGFLMNFNGYKPIKELSDVYKSVCGLLNKRLAIMAPVSPFDANDVVHSNSILSYDVDRNTVKRFFEDIKDTALRDGKAFAAVPPTPLVLNLLAGWSRELERDAVRIVPLSSFNGEF